MLTRFEYARILGARALQISMGAPVLVESDEQPVPEEGSAQNQEQGDPTFLFFKFSSNSKTFIKDLLVLFN